MMRAFLAALSLPLLLLFTHTITADRAGRPRDKVEIEKPLDITGLWWFESSQGNSKSQGSLHIIRLKDVYIFQWHVHGGPSINGIGMHDNGRYIVSWSYGDRRGINSYSFLPKGSGKGRWATANGLTTDGDIHTEKLTFIKRLPPVEEGK